MKKGSQIRCVCGSQKPQKVCCEPYLNGRRQPPTAEALMRSRYSAFCTGNLDYLIATHRAPQPSDQNPAESLKKTMASTQWVNLIVLATHKGKAKDKTGVVEFVAAYREDTPNQLLSLTGRGSQVKQLHERSRFVKAQGQWLYTDGDMLPPYTPKPGQPCWCGSGQKYRACHGARPLK